MSKQIRYGILGTMEVERDDDGYIEVPVVIQESGLYFGSAPPELRIHDVLSRNDPEFAKLWVAKLNRNTDLPFYLAIAKVKILQVVGEITDKTLLDEGIVPLPYEEA